jgi:hypothetical protein
MALQQPIFIQIFVQAATSQQMLRHEAIRYHGLYSAAKNAGLFNRQSRQQCLYLALTNAIIFNQQTRVQACTSNSCN